MTALYYQLIIVGSDTLGEPRQFMLIGIAGHKGKLDNRGVQDYSLHEHVFMLTIDTTERKGSPW